MTIYSPKGSGLGNSAAYQVAGKPYLTASTIEAEAAQGSPVASLYARREYKVTFPSVTRFVRVTNNCTASELAVYFSPREAAGQSGPLRNAQYSVIPPAQSGITGSFEAHVKCRELFITAGPIGGLTGSIFQPQGDRPVHAGTFGVFAEVTHIPAGNMYELTGSGINAQNFSDGVH